MIQTALQWLHEIAKQREPDKFDWQQAKQMEKEQHQETFKQSRQAKIFEKDMPPVWESWEQYYNETYKGNK